MSKVKRSSNFSRTEEEMLIKLVLEKTYIIENKRTNAATSRRKEAAWNELADKFNSFSSEPFRTVKVLRHKFNNMKRSIRKAEAEKNLVELCLESPMLNQLSGVLGVSLDGLESDHDDEREITQQSSSIKTEYSDDEAGEPILCSEFEEKTIKTEEEIILSPNSELYNPATPLSARHNSLSPSQKSSSSKIEYSDDDAVDLFLSSGPEKNTLSNNSEKHNSQVVRNKRHKSLVSSKNCKKAKKNEDSEIQNLKKRILEQQLKHAQLEHQQKMLQSAEEHKIRIKILEAELKIKQLP